MISKVQLPSLSPNFTHRKNVCFLINNENIQLPDLHTLYSVFLVLCLTVHHPSIYVSNIFPYTLIYFLAP